MSGVGWGVLGAAAIADHALCPAINAAENGALVAIAARDRARAQVLADRHGIPRVHASYDKLLEDPTVSAVYLPLANSDHRRWTLRALAAGKHVLCEKPLALNATEAREMAAAAETAGLLLMEAFMYRFHPRMRALHSSVHDPRFVHAAFSFRLESPGNYRWHREFGGGALLDVGCYTLDVVRWLLGEPLSVGAVVSGGPVDMTVAAVMEFGEGRKATVWASFEAAEHQQLVVVDAAGSHQVTEPFTAWHDPDDPYQRMVEEFGAAVLSGSPAPRLLSDSIATAELIDRVRGAAAAPVGVPLS
ncbi:MAG: Gfo/Idh/MocA family protein [Candidatus Dormibacteria bacterium]